MPSQRHKSGACGVLEFYSSAASPLLVAGAFSLKPWQIEFGQVTAQSPMQINWCSKELNTTRQETLEVQFRLGKTALTFYQRLTTASIEAIVLENLARAYQQLGQSEQALSHCA